MRDEELGPELRSRLTYALKHALLDLEQLHRGHLDPLGINVRELTVLQFLAGREPESQQQAAARLGVDRTTMVGLLDGLQAKGLLARRVDADDRRRNVVEVTAAGRRMLRKGMLASDAAERELLGALDEAEAAQLRTLLGRLAAGPR